VENHGSVAGGGAIELVAEEGEIMISNELTRFRYIKIQPDNRPQHVALGNNLLLVGFIFQSLRVFLDY